MSESNAKDEGGRPGMLRGVAWMLGFRLFDRAAGVISMLVLARLLMPEHFGIVALATAVLAFIELLSQLGLDTILIQHRQLDRDHYDTAWTIQFGIAAFCAVLLALAAVPASGFFSEPRLQPVIYALAFGMLLDGAVNIRIVDFRREMRFDREFVFMASRRTVSLVVTITAAVLLRNEWALAIGIITSRAVGVIASHVMIPHRPRFTLARRQELLTKSTWLFLSNVVYFVRQRASDFTLGRMLGPASVGAYSLASDLANVVGQELVAPINRVALPDLSARATGNAVARRFDLITGQVAIVLSPLCVGLSATAPLLVPLLFGAKWMAAAAVLQVLALAALAAGLGSNIGVSLLSLGRYRANAWIQAIGAVTLLATVVVGVRVDGLRGAALAVLVANAVTVVASLVYGRSAMDYGLSNFVRRIWRPLAAAGLMYAAIALAFGGPPPTTAAALTMQLAATIALGAAVYVGALAALGALSRDEDAAERLMLRLLRDQVWRRVRGARA